MPRPKGSKNKVLKEKPIKSTNPKGTISKYRMHEFLGATLENKIDMLAKALIKHRGFYTDAAYELKIDIRTVSKLVAESDYLAYVVAEIKHKEKEAIQKVGVDRVLDGSNPELQYKYWKEFIKNKNMREFGWDNNADIQITQNSFKQVVMNFSEPKNQPTIEGLDEKLFNE